MALRWRMLLLLAAARLGLGFQFQTLASTGEYLIADFGFDYTQIGALIGIFMLPGLFLSLPVGFAGRYVSDRVLAGLGLALLAVGGVLVSIADGYGLIATGRAICGAGFLLSTLYMVKMVADWFSGHEIATAMSILVMTWPLGIAAAQILHEYLAATVHWTAAFQTASILCAVGSTAVLTLYRSPKTASAGPATSGWRLSRGELVLTLSASLVWALFNAGYIVYLSFSPKVLTGAGMPALEAAAIISVASWIMMISGAVAGQVADRTGRPDVVLYVCMAVAIGALMLLAVPGLSLVSSLAFGLIGMAPAGIIMALTGAAMRPENRAFGMGLFFSGYFLVTAPAPVIAGSLFDRSGDAFDAVIFASALFGAVAIGNLTFRILHRRLGPV
ncbi:MAG: MFS transporter [Pseudomonadota bacterium]